MTIIEQIRAEIERPIKDPLKHCYGISSVSKLKELLSFLSTLESEKPINQEGLEKEIEKFLNETGAPYVWCNDDEQKEWCSIIARHFAKWGAEHLR